MNFKRILTNTWITGIINFLKYATLLCIVIPLINYAAINREIPVMSTHGLPYDVGMGQKLLMSCKGQGLPTSELNLI